MFVNNVYITNVSQLSHSNSCQIVTKSKYLTSNFNNKVQMELEKKNWSKQCVRCPWLQAEVKVATILGIIPLVVVVGAAVTKIQEGVVVGF
jgi:hypothetical protein